MLYCRRLRFRIGIFPLIAIVPAISLGACNAGTAANPLANAPKAIASPTPFAVASSPDLGLIAMPRAGERVKRYRFRTLDNPADPTFNILTGINNAGVISGYYGSGTPGHPSRGYTLAPPYSSSNYSSEDYPGSTQTQVMAIDNIGNSAGNFVDKKGARWGFIEWYGAFARYRQPLYGLNTTGHTVVSLPKGYSPYKIYTLNQATRKLTLVHKFPQYHDGFNQGTGLNDAGVVVGTSVGQGPSLGWAVVNGKLYWTPCDEDSMSPSAVNNNDEVVGYISGRFTYDGFVLTNLFTEPICQTIDDPNGSGQTKISGINDMGDLVGTYVDSAGNTNGFMATPR